VTVRREPLLFGIVLVLAGALTAMDLTDRYRRARIPSARTLEAEDLPRAPRVEGRTPRPAASGPRRTDAFAPPRELLPLDPLVLPEPPLPPLPLRRPAVTPSLAGIHARAYRVATRSLGSLELEAEAPRAGLDALPDDLAATGDDQDGPDDESAPEPPEPDQEAYERRYDWVSRVDSMRRLYGRILNEDPHGLGERRDEPLLFQQVSSATGRPLGAPFEIARDDVAAWGLARTFENLYLARSREIGTGLGSVSARRDLALAMLAAWPEESRGLEFARREAERAHAASPDDPATLRLLALVHRRAHDVEAELATYRDAVEQGIADAPLYVAYARLVHGLGLTGRARELLDEARRASGTNGEIAWFEGELLLEEGRLDEAVERLRTAQQLPLAGPLEDRQRDALAVALGRALVASGRPEDALREASRVLVERPGHTEALVLRGAAQAALDELEEAASSFDEAMVSEPTAWRPAYDAGVVAWRLRDGPGARRLLEQARDVDPLRALRPTLALGFLYEDAGEPETARDHYTRALTLEPDSDEALYRLGRARRRDGDPEGATTILRRALRLSGPETLLLAELGRAAMDRGAHEEAQRYVREALRLEPDNPRLHWALGLGRLYAGDLVGAVAPLEQASAGGMAGAHAGLGASAYRRGDETGALDHLDAVVRAYAGAPDDPQAVYAREQAARIRDNLSKRQWVDEFCRSSLQRGWTEHAWDGSPRVVLGDCAVLVEGRVERPREDERPGITRLVAGRTFFEVHARVAARPGAEGGFGLSLTHRQLRGALGQQPKARLVIEVDADGRVLLSTLDNFDTVDLDREPVPGARVAPGTPVSLGIERLDETTGRFGFLVDGRRVGEPVELKSLRNFENPFECAVFAHALPGRVAGASIERVRIVRAP